MGKLYNLFWDSGLTRAPHTVPLQVRATIDRWDLLQAIILWPAFFAPELHVQAAGSEPASDDDDRFELLLLAPSDPPLTRDMVNRQLRISRGLDARKPFTDAPLFDNPANRIEVQPANVETIDGEQVISVPAWSAGGPRFRGVLHGLALAKVDPEFTSYYGVRVHRSCLDTLEVFDGAIVMCDEYQDRIIRDTLQRLNGENLRPDQARAQSSSSTGTEGFVVSDGKVDPSRPSFQNRICAYHPLLVLEPNEARTLRLAHVTDMHINVRQDILARSPARVIEYGLHLTTPLPTPGVPPPVGPIGRTEIAESPAVGNLVSRYAIICGSILEAAAREKPQLVLIGGDLVDHADNAHDGNGADHPMSPTGVWEAVSIRTSEAPEYATIYEHNRFIDLIAAWSLFKGFVDQHQIPMCGITGNHDGYRRAYGISPQVAGYGKANEGIPADHNLTFYEAMLLFGPSYGSVFDNKDNPHHKHHNFYPELLEWHHKVFTPFASCSMVLGGYRLVALGWGNDEVMVEDKLPVAEHVLGAENEGQGLAHLPRANKAPSGADLALVHYAAKRTTPAVLLTHYTFASFRWDIPVSVVSVREEINFAEDDWSRFTAAQMGTFQKQPRRDLFADVFQPGGPFRCVLTGHSHRKGFYQLRNPEQLSDPKQTRIDVDCDRLDHAQRTCFPVEGTPIILSDSSGPTPKRNDANEFNEWGGDQASGTLVELAADGTLSRVGLFHPRGTTALDLPLGKPRVAVALDYLHVMEDKVFQGFSVAVFEESERLDAPYRIDLELRPDLVSAAGISPTKIVFYAMIDSPPDPLGNWREWVRVVALEDEDREEDEDRHEDEPDHQRWTISDDPVTRESFFRWLTYPNRSARYVSLHFKSTNEELDQRYDWTTAWNLEVSVHPEWPAPGMKKYVLKSPTRSEWIVLKTLAGPGGVGAVLTSYPSKEEVEPPDFAWRRSLEEY